MPLYEYVCYNCGDSFEKLRRIQDDDGEVRCPTCGYDRIGRVFSVVAKTDACGSGSTRFR